VATVTVAAAAAAAVVVVVSVVRKVSAVDSAEMLVSPDYSVASYAGQKVSSLHFVECYVDGPTISGSAATRFDVGTVVADWMVLIANSADPSISGFVVTSFPEFVAVDCQRSRTMIAASEVLSHCQSPNSCDSPVLVVPVVASE